MIKRRLIINQLYLSKLIRELRQETGLTQEQFASELGVTCSSVNRWENGRSKPLPLAMQKILEMPEQIGDRGQDLLKRYLAE